MNSMTTPPVLEQKATYIQQSFARIATGYDRTNRAMTFGMDRQWRDYVVRAIAPPIRGRALDVGTGTGDFLPLLAEWAAEGITVGVDFCQPMMHEGQHKLDAANVAGRSAFVTGDALCLPFPDNSFDAITTGFVLRNVTDIDAALREMWRVARPGAALACLDVARPTNPLVRLGHRFYFEQVVPWIGALLNNDRQFYTYLPNSARTFPTPDVLARMMHAAGWQFVQYKLLGLGAVAVHVGTKV